MHCVYILKSKKDGSKYYVGLTNNLKRRLSQHNDVPTNSYTIKHAPWKIETYIAFEKKEGAEQFEIYLKSPSGKAFLLYEALTQEYKSEVEP